MVDSKKTKPKSRKKIKKRFLDSKIIDENLKFDDLNKEAEEVQEPEKAAIIINGMKILLKQQKKVL